VVGLEQSARAALVGAPSGDSAMRGRGATIGLSQRMPALPSLRVGGLLPSGGGEAVGDVD